MAYSPSEIKVKPIVCPSLICLIKQLSLRNIKRIILMSLACTIASFLILWQPAYLHLRALQKEKIYWQNVLQAESVNTEGDDRPSIVPTMDQLPDMIDQCRNVFIKESVNVFALNVERFGERLEIGKGVSLDYGLVRFRLRGPWEGILRSLKILEEMQGVSIYVQEVVLDSQGTEGGEALLRIDFCTGE
ncbi:hypothetical protein [Desulfosporosinus sp. Sb-LF]|uniref:hypothetical protein n=1 Tax=Desulfosporosinus sp. Sb-LF TaxID=2560027 RepID=UPI00107F8CED|nr:hypothetical protein [Desulfosporosinus sp. Sb-LF]TGE34215.1 hypothetical protein E4K68_00455 [Desulfosporosinus sp. Sb-LF]